MRKTLFPKSHCHKVSLNTQKFWWWNYGHQQPQTIHTCWKTTQTFRSSWHGSQKYAENSTLQLGKNILWNALWTNVHKFNANQFNRQLCCQWQFQAKANWAAAWGGIFLIQALGKIKNKISAPLHGFLISVISLCGELANWHLLQLQASLFAENVPCTEAVCEKGNRFCFMTCEMAK